MILQLHVMWALPLGTAEEKLIELNSYLNDGYEVIGYAHWHDEDDELCEKYTLWKPDETQNTVDTSAAAIVSTEESGVSNDDPSEYKDLLRHSLRSPDYRKTPVSTEKVVVDGQEIELQYHDDGTPDAIGMYIDMTLSEDD